MRLTCRQCETILTKDLYQVKDFVKDPIIKDTNITDNASVIVISSNPADEYEERPTYSMKKGTFALLKHANPNMLQFEKNKKNANNFFVAPEDVLDQIQLVFKQGWGCCGNSYRDFKCPLCRSFLGYQHLDCYESKHVHFYHKHVVRHY